MSIERHDGLNQTTMFTPICDVCGDCLDSELEFYDAVDSKKHAGWKSKQLNGEWSDLCPDCQVEQSDRLKAKANSIVSKRKESQIK